MKQCIVCQKDFENTTKKQKFCSNACRQKNFRREVKEMMAEIRAKKAKIKPIEQVLTKESTIAIQKEIKPLESQENYDFSKVEIFQVSDFTKYPIHNRPKIPELAKSWDKLKLESDNKIRIQWLEYKFKNNS